MVEPLHVPFNFCAKCFFLYWIQQNFKHVVGNDFSEFVKCTEEVLVLEGPFLCQYCLSTINQIFQKLECCINIGLFSVFFFGGVS